MYLDDHRNRQCGHGLTDKKLEEIKSGFSLTVDEKSVVIMHAPFALSHTSTSS